MDPNEALRLIRLTIKQMRVDEDPGVRKAHAEEVAEYIEGLDEWLSKGGFLPTDWKVKPTIEIVHGRDPDAECGLDVFVNGERVEGWVEEDIDPGRGYAREDWDDRIESVREATDYTPAFREAVVRTLESYSGNRYIIED